VADVSLRIEHGQLVCLLGPSAAQDTTLRLIAGFIEPSAGENRGRRQGPVVAPAHRCHRKVANMSMIFQSYALWPHMTVPRTWPMA
jgi:iron(III) transport system ATP-binding protein